MQVEKIIAHIPTQDVEATAQFMFNCFDFEHVPHTSEYSELVNQDQTLGLLLMDTKPNQQSLYFRVSGVDSLWAKIEPLLDGVKTRAPFDQNYSMREFHLIIPETNTLLFVGEPIQRNS